MLGDRPAPYPSSPARREEALDTLLNPHEVMLLPLTSDALHGYARASAAEAAERASVLGEDGGGSTQQKPARRMVEPWGSLLLGDQDQEEEEDLQVGSNASDVPDLLVACVQHSTSVLLLFVCSTESLRSP